MNFSSILDKIKNAVYGVDVRQALHDGMCEIKNQEDKNQASFEKILSNLTEGNLDANSELIEARGKYNLLGKRLDDIDKKIKNNYNFYVDDHIGDNNKLWANKELSNIVQQFLAGTGQFTGVDYYEQLYINVYGKFDIVTIDGIINNSVFDFRKPETLYDNERRVFIDFSNVLLPTISVDFDYTNDTISSDSIFSYINVDHHCVILNAYIRSCRYPSAKLYGVNGDGTFINCKSILSPYDAVTGSQLACCFNGNGKAINCIAQITHSDIISYGFQGKMERVTCSSNVVSSVEAIGGHENQELEEIKNTFKLATSLATGKITIRASSANGGGSFPFPSGFDKNNCIVLSAMYAPENTSFWNMGAGSNSGITVGFINSNLNAEIRLNSAPDTDSIYDVRILLKKIGE